MNKRGGSGFLTTNDDATIARVRAKQQELKAARGPTKTEMVQLGEHWRRASYGKLGADTPDLRIIGELRKFIEGMDPEWAMLPDLQLQAFLYARWARWGYRQVVMSHKLAASLMCTKLTQSAADQIEPPWPTFVVEVPDGLASLEDSDGNLHSVRNVLAGRWDFSDGTQRWGFCAQCLDSPVSIWRFGMHGSELSEERPGSDLPDAFEESITDVDGRTASLLGRLITGVCLTMSDPSNVKMPEEPKLGKKRGGKLRDSGEPKVRTCFLKRATNVDCRETVQEYIRNGSSKMRGALSVQTMVAGHWKAQRFGVGGSQRKVIHVEPYWRGPEDAPISVATTKLK